MAGMIRITLVKSSIGRPKKHKLVLEGMGLNRLHKTVELIDSPETRGMIKKVEHLVRIEA